MEGENNRGKGEQGNRENSGKTGKVAVGGREQQGDRREQQGKGRGRATRGGGV